MNMLIVEDEEKSRLALKTGFTELGFHVKEAANGIEGLKVISSAQVDIIISDIVMPKMTGMEFLSELRKQGSTLPVIMLTAMGQTEDKIKGLEIGADDYLEKPYDFHELVARVHALLRRTSKQLQPEVLSYADLILNKDAKTAARQGRDLNLTPKEFALVSYFIANKERVISKAEIAEKVWDITFDTNTNIIEVYISYLRQKVDKPFDTALIHTCHGHGYMLKDK